MLHFSANSTWDSSGAGKIKFSPMESGTHAGIAIFGSRSDTKAPIFKLTGNKDYFVSGTVYLPKQDLRASRRRRSERDRQVGLRHRLPVLILAGNSNFTFDAYGGVANTGLVLATPVLVQ